MKKKAFQALLYNVDVDVDVSIVSELTFRTMLTTNATSSRGNQSSPTMTTKIRQLMKIRGVMTSPPLILRNPVIMLHRLRLRFPLLRLR
jgi:hypothetical protein